jgi:enamine deaminase RidA (YjgF/YER057c/UK114 family)
MLKEYYISMPSVSASLEEEWEQCSNDILDKIRAGYRPLKLNIFIDSPDQNLFFRYKKKISESVTDTFRDQSPSFNITIHPPERPWKVAAECMYQKKGPAEIKTKYHESVPYVLIASDSRKEIWAAGLGNELLFNDTRKAAAEAFEKMAALLSLEGLSFNNIVRQWNYIGNILEVHDGYQNYQVFNEVRSEYYSKYRTVGGFPAATGIGMKHSGVYIDFCAISGNNNLMIKAINNPNQVNAYQYSQRVLKGFITKGKSVKNPPQFERALFLNNHLSKTLFISGTASIIGQETIGKEDVIEQTLVTIENINKLKDGAYIGQVTGQELLSGKCAVIRVYIRNQNDFSEVRRICEEHFPGAPSVFIESDICRDDLLVEIEAEYNF